MGKIFDEDKYGAYPLGAMLKSGSNRRGEGGSRPVDLEAAGRVPPQAIDVEAYVLGAMLIEREAVTRALEVLGGDNPDVFYRDAHQKIYNAMVTLFDRGEPVDSITLLEELRRRGQVQEIGGAFYLTELTSKVTSAANIEYHARIIMEKSLLRKLITVSGQISSIAYQGSEDAFGLLDEAEQQIFAISQSHLRKGFVPIKPILMQAFEQIEANHNRAGGVTGVPSGMTSLDDMLSGFQPSDLIIVAARPSMGKCLGRGTRVMMHDGTVKPVEDIVVGEQVMGDDSTPRTVLSIARGREPMYWVRQRHGMDYRVNESHILSLKQSRQEGTGTRGSVVNLSVREYLTRSEKWRNNHKGYKVAVEFPEQPLPIDPYLLGLWLGDGKRDSARIYTADLEVVAYLHEYAVDRDAHVTVTDVDRCPGYTVTAGRSHAQRETSLQAELRRLGVLGNKHIPQRYLTNSRLNRLQLLAGLIDSDGHCNKGHGGTYEITLKDEALARQIKFLCDSLGYRTSFRQKRATISAIGYESTVWRVRFNGDVDAIPVRIDRKKAAPWTDRRDWTVTGLTVEPDGEDDYYGFTLDGNHLFLLEDATVTHNTAFTLSAARNAAVDYNIPIGFFSLEMSATQLAMRLLCAEARVDAHAVRTGRLPDADWMKLSTKVGELAKAKLFIDDTPGLSILELRAKARRLKSEHDIKLIIIDYLQLMSGPKSVASREQEIAHISRSLKALAKELNVPVIALSQLSRAVEQRGGDKRPILSDLRESGSIEQDADVVLFLHRPEKYGITVDEDGNSTEGIAEIIVGKQRNGPIGHVTVAFVKDYARFENLATQYNSADYLLPVAEGYGAPVSPAPVAGFSPSFVPPPPGDAPF